MAIRSSGDAAASTRLLIRGIRKSYGRREVLRDLSLALTGGRVVGIVGENGAGKSTLLRVLSGDLSPDAGAVTCTGRIGFCPQTPVLNDALTVRSVPAEYVNEYLDGQREDVKFAGFATEADVTAYIERLSAPALLLAVSVVLGGAVSAQDQARCRAAAQVAQRVDFLADLAEDLDEGRLHLPLDALDAHGVRRADLEHRRDTVGVRALLEGACRHAREFMDQADQLAWTVPPQYRSTARAGMRVHRYWLDAVERAGAGVLRRTVAIPLAPSAWALLQGIAGMPAR